MKAALHLLLVTFNLFLVTNQGADESAGEEEKEPVHSVDDPHRLLNVDLERSVLLILQVISS